MSLSKSRFIEMFDLYKEKKLSEVAEIIMGQSPDSKSYNNTEMGLPFYQGKTEFSDKYIGSPVTWCSSPCRIAEKNDILMSVRAPVGDVNIATEKCCIGRGLASIRPLDGESTFLFYALKLKKEEIASKGNGSTFKAINKETVHSITIPDVPQGLKVKFSMFAEQIDKSKFLLQKILEKLELLKKSRFIELFGDQIANPYKWKQLTIGECCILKSGTSLSVSIENEGGPIPYVKVSDMNMKENEKYIKTSTRFVSYESSKKVLIPKGSVIFPKRGAAIATNKKRITSLPICADLNIMSVFPKKELTSEYLYSYFLNIDLSALYNGSSVPQINNKDISPLVISVPPLKLQKDYSEFVNQIDKSKLVIQKSLEDLVGKS